MRIASLAATILALCGSAVAFAEEGRLNTPPPGFTALFNGQDLTNWQGMLLDGDPYKIAALSPNQRATLQAEADAAARQDWQVIDGILYFDGTGKNLVSTREYRDFELYVDFKIEPDGDSGIYLRGTPQVQIWDPALNNIGSGGLYNNHQNASEPLGPIADNPVGEWNSFFIRMVGDKVTVKLNGQTVVDETPLENYWRRDQPLLAKGTIELQNFRTPLYFRNIYVRDLTPVDTQIPLIVVGPGVVVPTDHGKAFATNVLLPRPLTSDDSGRPVTVTSDAPSTYPLGVTTVTWTATDEAGNKAMATQNATVLDQEKPTLAVLPAVQRFCDPGKVFATVRLAPPSASDNVALAGPVTTTAGSTFEIGTKNVVWTAEDAAGNFGTSVHKVTVINRRPRADAGRDVVVTTRSERGVRLSLDGSDSSDPDRQKLKYLWSAPGVKFQGATTAKPSGHFPVGKKSVALLVVDAGYLRHKDTVRVTVRLKNAKPRPRGSDANRSFAAASRAAGDAGPSLSSASAEGRTYAALAACLGDAAGEFVRWEDGQSPEEAALAYAELRASQCHFGAAAVSSLLAAYAETGDERLLSAASHAAYGALSARADLAE